MMDVSDTYILPVVGYRGWVLREGKLSSYAVDNFWIPKKANVAQCGGYEHVKFWGSHKIRFGPKLIPHASYVAPLAECGCGFYAFRTLPYLVEWLEHREPNIVVGEVYLWGKVVDCQYGYRAQCAYPKRFYSNSYEYEYAYNNSTFALREFNVPIEPMPETVTQPELYEQYRRRELHQRFGRQRQGGISTPATAPFGFVESRAIRKPAHGCRPAVSADASPSDVLASCLTVPPHKTSVEIEQATSSYSFRFSELSQPI